MLKRILLRSPQATSDAAGAPPSAPSPDAVWEGQDDIQNPPGEAAQDGDAKDTKDAAEVVLDKSLEAPVETPTTGLSKDDITAILKNAGLGQPSTAAVPDAPAAMSPEELEKAMNVFKVQKDNICALFGLDPEAVDDGRVQAFNGFVQNIVKQAVTMSGFHVQAVQQQLLQQIAPALAIARAQQEEALKEEFFAENADLKDYEPLLREIKDRLESQGFKGTKEDAFKTIATQARTILKSLPGMGGQNGTPPGGKTQAQTQPTTRRKMSTVSAGGQAGSGAGGPPSGKSGPESVWS